MKKNDENSTGGVSKILLCISATAICQIRISTLQEHQRIRTIARAGKNSDLQRVPLPAAMFVVNRRNLKFYKAFSDI